MSITSANLYHRRLRHFAPGLCVATHTGERDTDHEMGENEYQRPRIEARPSPALASHLAVSLLLTPNVNRPVAALRQLRDRSDPAERLPLGKQ